MIKIDSIAKTFDPKSDEPLIYKEWLDRDAFHAEAPSDKESFTIVMPPPNIGGRQAERNERPCHEYRHGNFARLFLHHEEVFREKCGDICHDYGCENPPPKKVDGKDDNGDQTIENPGSSSAALRFF